MRTPAPSFLLKGHGWPPHVFGRNPFMWRPFSTAKEVARCHPVEFRSFWWSARSRVSQSPAFTLLNSCSDDDFRNCGPGFRHGQRYMGQERYCSTSQTENKGERTKSFLKESSGKLRQYFRMYGMVGAVVYGSVYVGTIALLFLGVESNIVGGDEVLSFLKSSGLDSWVDASLLNTKQGSLALAWILTKFTEPARMAISVAITPSIARAVGRAPPKPSKH